MGGAGSGQYPNNGNWRGGRKKQENIGVVGRGLPERPTTIPEPAIPFWDYLVDLTAGVAFSQDSYALASLASLMWRQCEITKRLQTDPVNEVLNRISLAIDRQSKSLFEQFGLTPKSRQLLQVIREDDDEEDELEKLQRSF